ncbi:MAG: outer membrane protein assembly factor BamD [Cytophagales bacterium]|nr:MAG: outer membrane protein assembly factor BamD [Cytophagales bacterium]
MRIYNLYWLILFLMPGLLINQAVGQITLQRHSENVTFQTATELMEKQKYSAARAMFENYLQNFPNGNKAVEAKYNIANSSLQLFNPDAEQLFEQFITQHPNHSKSNLAYFDLANFYFKNQNLDKSILYFEKVNISLLSKDQVIETRFKQGYAYFSKKDFEKALPLFNEIKNEQSNYKSSANYYTSYISYKKGDYETALVDITKTQDDPTFKALAQILAANIYYKKADYDQCISYSEQVLKSNNSTSGTEELILLIAESWYHKNNYEKAIQYYKQYTSLTKVKPSNEVQFRIGDAAFKTKDYTTAVNNLKNTASTKDTVSQASSYLLGVSYIRLDNKLFALSAFDQARKADFNSLIKKQSEFNYAKLCTELEKYSEAVSILKNYTKKYPNDANYTEAQELLTESLINSNNPSEALEYLASIKSKTPRLNAAFQKVSFHKAIELYNDNKFIEAIEYFDKAINAYSNIEIKVAANFWKGEALSVLKEYDAAIACYSYVFQNKEKDSEYYTKSRYGIGYAYYNNKLYDKAIPHFRTYVSQFKNSSIKYNYNDALLRLADLLYVTKQYDEAILTYNEYINLKTREIDYALYQKGLIAGITGKYQEAISALDFVINKYPNSLYFDNALFQKADFELEQSNYNVAIADFTKLINLHPQSGYIPYALLKRAIALSNLQKHSEAVSDYKQLLEKYPTHPLAQNALLGLQEAINASGKSENMETLLAKYKEANPQSDALIKIEFENAKTYYNDQKYSQTIEAYNNFIKNYSNSIFQQEANYYLAESYFRTKDNINAIGAYRIIIQDASSPYFNKALARLAELEFENQSYQASKQYYKQLLDTSKNKKERSNAWLGLMQSNYFLKQYDSATLYANEIIQSGNVTADAESKALLYMGKIALATAQNEKAIDAFINTVNNAKDESGAEAQYLIAEILYKEKKHKQSLETLYDLNNNFTPYEKWLNSSFLLISDNFIQMNELFQAKATLQSIIDKSTNKELIEIAKSKLKSISTEESNSNKLDSTNTQ